MGAQQVCCPGDGRGQFFIFILIRLSSVREGVFILRIQTPVLRVLIAAAILGELVLPKVGVVLVKLGALFTVRLLVGLPFLFFWASSWRAPGPRGSGLLDVAARVSIGRRGGSEARSPPQGASWRVRRDGGGQGYGRRMLSGPAEGLRVLVPSLERGQRRDLNIDARFCSRNQT